MRPSVETWTLAGLGDDLEGAAAVRPIPAMEGLDLEEFEPAEMPNDEPDGTGFDRMLVPVRA